VSNVSNSNATLEFVGTSIRSKYTIYTLAAFLIPSGVVFGAKRSNHGAHSTSRTCPSPTEMHLKDAYTVNLDGTDVSASGKGDDQFGAVLFDSGVLSRGPHSVIVRNTALIPDRSVANLDIDWVSASIIA